LVLSDPTLKGIGDDEIKLEPEIFTQEHFKAMIMKTFSDFYPGKFNLKPIILDDYLRVVQELQLVTKYGSHLVHNGSNTLTIKSMPWFDLGDLPIGYDKTKEEHDQIWMVPKNKPPEFMVCEYNELGASFMSQGFLKNFHE
jgi:hypothetical protein